VKRQDGSRQFKDQDRPRAPHTACAKGLDCNGPVPEVWGLSTSAGTPVCVEGSEVRDRPQWAFDGFRLRTVTLQGTMAAKGARSADASTFIRALPSCRQPASSTRNRTPEKIAGSGEGRSLRLSPGEVVRLWMQAKGMAGATGGGALVRALRRWVVPIVRNAIPNGVEGPALLHPEHRAGRSGRKAARPSAVLGQGGAPHGRIRSGLSASAFAGGRIRDRLWPAADRRRPQASSSAAVPVRGQTPRTRAAKARDSDGA
jgi:hypothetical protein